VALLILVTFVKQKNSYKMLAVGFSRSLKWPCRAIGWFCVCLCVSGQLRC